MSNVVNTASSTVLSVGLAAALGYGAAKIFTKINPVHGAVFAATSALVSKIVQPIFDKIFAGPGANDASKAVGVVVGQAAGIGISAAICTGLGYPITFEVALILAGSVLIATIATVVAVTATVGIISAATS